MTASWSWSPALAATWPWFAAAILPNVLALLLLAIGLRTTDVPQLKRMQLRAVLCLLFVGAAVGFGVVNGCVQAYRAMYDSTTLPQQAARQLAEAISATMNNIAVGLLSVPLLLAACIVLLVRRRRLERA